MFNSGNTLNQRQANYTGHVQSIQHPWTKFFFICYLIILTCPYSFPIDHKHGDFHTHVDYIMNSNFYLYLNLKIMAWSHRNIILWCCLLWFLRHNFHNRNIQQCYNFETYLILAWRHAGKMQVLWIKDHWYGVPVK